MTLFIVLFVDIYSVTIYYKVQVLLVLILFCYRCWTVSSLVLTLVFGPIVTLVWPVRQTIKFYTFKPCVCKETVYKFQRDSSRQFSQSCCIIVLRINAHGRYEFVTWYIFYYSVDKKYHSVSIVCVVHPN